MAGPRPYWFKAKSTGLGWSTPLTWQGGVVYVLMFGAMACCAAFGRDAGEKMLGVCVPVLMCLPIFLIYGEPLSRKKDHDR